MEGGVGSFVHHAPALGPKLQTKPDISGDRVVWEQPDGIRMYTISTGEITKLATFGRAPSISGDRVVWVDTRPPGNEIRLHNLNTHETQTMTKGDGFIMDLDFSGNWFAWSQRKNTPPWKSVAVKIYDARNKVGKAIFDESDLITSPLAIGQVSLHGSAVAYEFSADVSSTPMRVYDILTGATLAFGQTEDEMPSLWGDRLVWKRGNQMRQGRLPRPWLALSGPSSVGKCHDFMLFGTAKYRADDSPIEYNALDIQTSTNGWSWWKLGEAPLNAAGGFSFVVNDVSQTSWYRAVCPGNDNVMSSIGPAIRVKAE